MVRLVVRVTESSKWVTVEDLSGPQVKFHGLVRGDNHHGDEDETSHPSEVAVDIHSTDTSPGRVVVYAGRYKGEMTAKFHSESLTEPCMLVLSDAAIARDWDPETISDECEWENLMNVRPTEERSPFFHR